jgi:hypothetical protein
LHPQVDERRWLLRVPRVVFIFNPCAAAGARVTG